MYILDLTSVVAVIGLTVLRFGVPVLGIWLLSQGLKRVALQHRKRSLPCERSVSMQALSDVIHLHRAILGGHLLLFARAVGSRLPAGGAWGVDRPGQRGPENMCPVSSRSDGNLASFATCPGARGTW